MGDIQRINITLPKKLVRKTKILIDEGLYTNFSELIRESLKNELLLDAPLIEKKQIVDKWFKETPSEGEIKGKSREETLRDIRKTRNHLWETKYIKWFEAS
ncbi:MAG: ribbon-helix-helix domain-containing protein [Candidatus Woesearchaeota archaeon]|jgi:Arc/MetJ-type ribon-helix-helix transcriptional regulator|nr:ribbon-helix-helix domain-containing protein [Candidatus Woesearchaeota archaeon]MDP7324069.1 ribbon-helix-helix domain-containing protein [Candidatus Woesearchaeota archaeon]MDP7457593.1 ribbon-helix-helix domain-containing protein [Candidatus Woesearchaeota archaeon]